MSQGQTQGKPQGQAVSVYRAIESVESKVWWGPIVRGLAAIVIAVIIMAMNTGDDNTAVKAAVLLVGVFALINAAVGFICAIIDHSGASWRGPVLFALLSAAVGIALVAWPETSAKIAVVVFGVFVVAVGAGMSYGGMKLRKANDGKVGGMLIAGVVLVVLGIVIAFTPLFWAKLIIWLLAILLAVFGVVLIAIGFTIRKALKNTTVVSVATPPPA